MLAQKYVLVARTPLRRQPRKMRQSTGIRSKHLQHTGMRPCTSPEARYIYISEKERKPQRRNTKSVKYTTARVGACQRTTYLCNAKSSIASRFDTLLSGFHDFIMFALARKTEVRSDMFAFLEPLTLSLDSLVTTRCDATRMVLGATC